MRGELRAEEARAENPERHVRPRARDRLHRLRRPRSPSSACSSSTSCGKVSAPAGRAAARAGCSWSVPGRTAEPEVDPPGIERFERAELLGDHERRVVRQHDPARADPDRRRAARDMGDDDRPSRRWRSRSCCGAPRARSGVAPALGVPREVERIAQRVGGVSRPRRSARGRGSRPEASSDPTEALAADRV